MIIHKIETMNNLNHQNCQEISAVVLLKSSRICTALKLLRRSQSPTQVKEYLKKSWWNKRPKTFHSYLKTSIPPCHTRSSYMYRLRNSAVLKVLWVFHLSQYWVHFTKTGACKIYSAQGDRCSCDPRNYTAFIGDKKAHVFNYGSHSCHAKLASKRPTDLFNKLFQQTPAQDRQKVKVTPYYLIHVAKKHLEEVRKTVKK